MTFDKEKAHLHRPHDIFESRKRSTSLLGSDAGFRRLLKAILYMITELLKHGDTYVSHLGIPQLV